TIVSAPGEGPYTGIFTLPALARAGGRRWLEALPWFASAAAWAALLVAGLLYAGPDWQSAWALFTPVATCFLIHGYPLLRPARSRSPHHEDFEALTRDAEAWLDRVGPATPSGRLPTGAATEPAALRSLADAWPWSSPPRWTPNRSR